MSNLPSVPFSFIASSCNITSSINIASSTDILSPNHLATNDLGQEGLVISKTDVRFHKILDVMARLGLTLEIFVSRQSRRK